MKNKFRTMICIALMVCVLVSSGHSSAKGVDRNRFKSAVLSYPVTLTIGPSLSFNGTLSRVDDISDEEIDQAIKDTLKELGKTELDILEAERLVQKVENDEALTSAEVKEYRDNLLKLAGADKVVDIIEYLTNSGDKSASDIAGDFALDAAREKALEVLVGGAAGDATKILDTIMISSDQYEKDKEKWKNRAASSIAKRMLNDFYDAVEAKLYNKSSSRFRGWELKIDDTAYRQFSWNGAQGNIETCSVWMYLKKADDQYRDASGEYAGIVHVVLEYDMSGYDTSLKNEYVAVYFDNMVLSEVSDGGKPTTISRELDDSSFSIHLQAPVQKGAVTTHQLDVSNFSDVKSVSINREVILTAKGSITGYSSDYRYVITYSADSDTEILRHEVLSGNLSVGSKSKEVHETYDTTLPFDPSVWNTWKSSKELTVFYP